VTQKIFEEDQDVFLEWKDMPEFIQTKQEPHAQIIVRFRNQEDLDEFAQMIGQKLTVKTKSIWHPELVRGMHGKKRWIDES
jgi:hypothetical protein